ncbi:MAG TPA: imidazole glycerol phosphate synthase subunit HisF [Candidatus Kapabacteria bacterium]|nr:imidazole glycerol phosphate synthase subunit HisF [Candidatus Kapabacteria bacterium]
MLKVRIIPCLDCHAGCVVKGIRFTNLRMMGDPAELAARYEAEGADELVILDISATIEARNHQVATIRAVRERISIPITAGGGIRSLADCEALLAAGADKVSINSAAHHDPDLIDAIANRFGTQCALVAIDARRSENNWRVLINGGGVETERSVAEWAREAAARGAGEILLTSWDRDGTRAGYDLELLRAVTSTINIPVIASGGAANANHLAEAVQAGAFGLLAASLFHDGDSTISKIKQELLSFSIPVRL